MPTLLRSPRSIAASVFALVVALTASFALPATALASTGWAPIQSALHATGTPFPGNVLRFELVRQDLTNLTINGQTVPTGQVAAIANGFIAFKAFADGRYYVDGSLPALETEVSALQTALSMNKAIHITSIADKVMGESPRLTWVNFEAAGNGAAIASTLDTALKTIHSPQRNVSVILGTNQVFNPSKLLPPKFLKLFKEGTVEQLTDIFAFYLPRPDEHEIRLHDYVPAETGLGVGQSFYIQIPFSGGTNSATLNIDFALLPREVQPVEDTLRAGGFTITSQTNHYLDDQPRLVYVHATASGDGFSLGNTLYQAIQIIQQDSSRRDRDYMHDHGMDR